MNRSILTQAAALLVLLFVGCDSPKKPATQPTQPAAGWPPQQTGWPPPTAQYPPAAAQPSPAYQPSAPAAQPTAPPAAAPAQVSFCGMQLATDLRQLECHNRALTDLAPIRAFSKVEQLDLSDTTIRDIGPLASLTQLRTLDVSRTNVSDLSPLRGLRRLETLVAQTIPTDKLAADVPNLDESIDLTPLASLPALRELDLGYSLVVDLEPLTRIQTLAWVRVTGSFTDGYNVKKVRRAIRGCRVEF